MYHITLLVIYHLEYILEHSISSILNAIHTLLLVNAIPDSGSAEHKT